MKITCNLYDQWITAIRQEFTRAALDHSKLADQDCAIMWQAWKRRTVRPGARKILKAPGFRCPTHLQTGLTNLETAFSTGSTIWPWQSKLIDRPTCEDGLYNDYGVVHFHLGVGSETTGYINRTNELLFAVIDSSSVHEIGIYVHGDWWELDILEAIDANWPSLLDRVTLHGLDVAISPRTREEVKALRKAKVVPFFRLNSGRIIAPPGGGIASDGTSIEAVRSADSWAKVLRNGEKMIVANIEEQIQHGTMQDGDYTVFFHATDDEIAGVIGKTHKWILWKKP
jgi:hypothetical protein